MHTTHLTYCRATIVGFRQVVWRRELQLPIIGHSRQIDAKSFRIRHTQRFSASHCVLNSITVAAPRTRP